MQHTKEIEKLVQTLRGSATFHALLIQSPPGWAKSTTVEKALLKSNIRYHVLGSYNTPLSLYQAFCGYPDQVLVLDDCAGIFGNPVALSLLKAASWSSAGTLGTRRVSWESTSEKVQAPSVDFTGKLILLANAVPAGPLTESFRSRSICYSIPQDEEVVSELIFEAARSLNFFPDQVASQSVAKHLVDSMKYRNFSHFNLRTLQLGYELAVADPASWRDLLDHLLPECSPKKLVTELERS